MTQSNLSSLPGVVYTVCLRIWYRCSAMANVMIPFSFLGLAAASDTDQAVVLNGTFQPTQSDNAAVLKDVKYITSLFNLTEYWGLGASIRAGNRFECAGNLSLALASAGPIMQASTSGSSGALTLLPTAGALIGAPAKELWMLFKLVPLAGVLSMMLSLGGNIVPSISDDYEQAGYTYDGMIGTEGNIDDTESRSLSVHKLDPATFAQVVRARADNPLGGSKRMTAAIGMFSQLFWIGVIIFACCFTQKGAVVVWWCKAWAWMLGWYMMVAISSLLENAALVPFNKQWTIRACKTSSVTEISQDAPSILPFMRTNSSQDISEPAGEALSQGDVSGLRRMSEDMNIGPASRPELRSQKSIVDEYRTFVPQLARQRSNFLHNLEKHGLNTIGRAYISPDQPFAGGRHPFIIIISVGGVTGSRATIRVMSKAASIAAFAAGTAIFASASFISISVALTTLCLILGAGVFGRVASLWLISEMMKENPVIHRVVRSEAEAENFIIEILNTPGLSYEILGHVFVNGRCVKRYSRWFNWSNVLGILTSPYRPPRGK